MLDALVNAEATNLARTYYGEDVEAEQIERVKYTIREFSEMIAKGAEIHPALQAPENVKNLFPDFNKILSIESKTKMISDGNNKSTETLSSANTAQKQ